MKSKNIPINSNQSSDDQQSTNPVSQEILHSLLLKVKQEIEQVMQKGGDCQQEVLGLCLGYKLHSNADSQIESQNQPSRSAAVPNWVSWSKAPLEERCFEKLMRGESVEGVEAETQLDQPSIPLGEMNDLVQMLRGTLTGKIPKSDLEGKLLEPFILGFLAPTKSISSFRAFSGCDCDGDFYQSFDAAKGGCVHTGKRGCSQSPPAKDPIDE